MTEWFSMRAALLFAMMSALVLSGCIAADDESLAPGASDEESGAPDAPAPNITLGPVQEETASWIAGISGCGVLFLEDLAGTDHAWLAIRPDARGLPFTASYTSMVPAVDMGVSFFQGEGYLDTVAGMDPEISGTVPGDADTGIFWSCGGVEVSVTFVVGG